MSIGEYEVRMQKGSKEVRIYTVIIIWSVVIIACAFLYGCPQYNVYEQTLHGQAELARAQSNRMIAVQEAEAKFEASSKLANAEIERAKGVAKANEIIGSSLKGNADYLHYLWIQALHEKENQVIYVPTEANIPIMEAGKRR